MNEAHDKLTKKTEYYRSLLTEISRAEGRKQSSGAGVVEQSARLEKLVAGQRRLRVERDTAMMPRRLELEAKRAAVAERQLQLGDVRVRR